MNIDQFYRKTLGCYTKEQRDQLSLKEIPDCFKAFVTLCTEEADQTFGTPAFHSSVKALDQMSEYHRTNQKDGDKIEAMTAIRSVAACRLWEEYKTTYQIDPDFYSVFQRTEKLRVYPTELIHIPVPFFGIDLSHCPCEAEGMIVFIANTIGGITIGINVLYEYTVYQSICAIRYDECNVKDGVVSYDWKKSKLFEKDVVGEADAKLRENVEEIVQKEFNGDTQAFLSNLTKADPEQARFVAHMLDNYKFNQQNELEDLKLFLFQFLTYITCKNPDIRESRDSAKAQDRAVRLGKVEKLPRTYEVGKRFGKSYSLLMKEQREKQDLVVKRGEHSSPIPHLVSAHWHGYWCGKGRTEYQVRWIACYFKGGVENAFACDEIVHECEEEHTPIFSHGEKILYQSLAALGLEYIPQFRVETGRIFDACVNLHNRKIMVEYDGEQHFHPVADWDFEATKASDREKNAYCKELDIPLLRIRYDEILKITDILKELKLRTLKAFPKSYWLSEIPEEEYYTNCMETEKE